MAKCMAHSMRPTGLEASVSTQSVNNSIQLRGEGCGDEPVANPAHHVQDADAAALRHLVSLARGHCELVHVGMLELDPLLLAVLLVHAPEQLGLAAVGREKENAAMLRARASGPGRGDGELPAHPLVDGPVDELALPRAVAGELAAVAEVLARLLAHGAGAGSCQLCTTLSGVDGQHIPYLVVIAEAPSPINVLGHRCQSFFLINSLPPNLGGEVRVANQGGCSLGLISTCARLGFGRLSGSDRFPRFPSRFLLDVLCLPQGVMFGKFCLGSIRVLRPGHFGGDGLVGSNVTRRDRGLCRDDAGQGPGGVDLDHTVGIRVLRGRLGRSVGPCSRGLDVGSLHPGSH